ncbi:MAG: hypothetical protein HY737_08475 [Candidatus Omnitrophica bacterium]|nr:hypothetical protein [Candidatus Omnitrophota bacterium]
MAILLAYVGITAAWAADPEVTVQTAVDKAEVEIGEPVRYAITAEYPAGSRVSWPAIGAVIGEMDVEDRGAATQPISGGRMRETRWYRLRSYDVGSHAIPPPAIGIIGSDGQERAVSGEATAVTVNSGLPASDWKTLDIRDAKPPVFLVPWRAILIGGALLLLIGAGLGVWWVRQRRVIAPTSPPPRPPHEEAFEDFARLEAEGLLPQHREEEYVVRLSAIARVYIERCHGLRAPEMTTEEFLHAATTAQALAPDQQQLLRDFLTACDLVKFARYRPSVQEGHALMASARRFVQQTMPAETVPTPQPELRNV